MKPLIRTQIKLEFRGGTQGRVIGVLCGGCNNSIYYYPGRECVVFECYNCEQLFTREQLEASTIPLEITIYCNSSRHNNFFTAYLPNAVGSGFTAWEALADALKTWERRGKPPLATLEIPPCWVVSSMKRVGDRFVVEGENLNYPPTHRDRRFNWSVSDLSPGYEFIGEAATFTSMEKSS
mgnify:CR=1 FL=1